jgi:hypothetical protein
VTGEISYDLVMDEDMPFVEGTYRLPDHEWQVLIFSKKEIPAPTFDTCSWDSGVTGVVVHVPLEQKLSKAVVEAMLSSFLSVEKWTEVRGPDSMQLR